MKKRPIGTMVWAGILLLAPIVLWILPADYFDNSERIICPSRALFEVECPGCGLTRGVMHLHHFDFEEALYFNNLVFIVYPALVILWGYLFYQAYRKIKLAA